MSHVKRQIHAKSCKTLARRYKSLQNSVEEKLPCLGPAANASVDSMDVSMISSGNPVVGGKLRWVISYAKTAPL